MRKHPLKKPMKYLRKINKDIDEDIGEMRQRLKKINEMEENKR